VPDLIARPALGRAEVVLAGTRLAEAPQPELTSIAPFPGQTPAVTHLLEQALGLGFPAPNRVTGTGDVRLIWAGRDLAFLTGAAAPDGLRAAITDQSDAWVALTLTGPHAVAVLARLVSLDLREMAPGQCARTALNHLPLLLVADAPDSFTLVVWRSMATTAWTEVEEAMHKVAARAAMQA
jgi:sarcosine oxidase subunit gamma